MRFTLVRAALVSVMVAPVASAQAPPQWSGSMQCTLSSNGTDYQEEQTHTWQLLPGDPLPFDQWPAVWAVQGKGTRRITSTAGIVTTDTWTIAVPQQAAPIRIAPRPASSQIEIRSTHGMLVGRDAISVVSSSGQRWTESLQEWAFPVVDGPTANPTISGTRTRKLESGNAWRKPMTVWTIETCTWSFSRGGRVETISLAPAPAAPTTSTLAAPVLSPTAVLAPSGASIASSTSTAPSSAALPTAATTTSQAAPPPVNATELSRVSNTSTVTATTLGTRRSGGLTEVPGGTTVTEVTPVLTGPTRLTTGSQGTFKVVILTPPGAHAITSGQVIFNSGEGEASTVRLGGPSSSPATATDPASFSAAFTFERPGTYVVSGNATAASTYHVQVAYTVTIPVYGYDPQCNCQKEVGTRTETRYETVQRTNSYAAVKQQQVVVAD